MPSRKKAAIIGMSCRLPGNVNSPQNLWDFCTASRCSAGPIPKERFNTAQFYHPGRKNGHFNNQAGSFLDQDVGVFDAPFFNISEAEAKSLDPQYRLLLETTFQALENSGTPLSAIAGRGDVGVFAAGSPADYLEHTRLDPLTASAYVGTSNEMTMFANRISYFFDLKGPSLTISTACSSSLTALHMAVESITTGECTYAIVGGSCLQLSPQTIAAAANLGTLSDEGKSFSFDHRANGYGRGEGSVCIVLKALDQATQDNDSMRAIVRGSGVNHGGRTQGITLPNGEAQASLMASVYRKAGLNPHDTMYVEAHGTGTERGDPIEAGSIAFGLKTKTRGHDNPLYVGSVKSNFGHLEPVSGLVSVVKCILMLERGIILPSANFEKANPAINLELLNIKIPTECVPWPQGMRRTSINNFGFGGSNAHIILEQAPETASHFDSVGTPIQEPHQSDTSSAPMLFPFSAKNEASLQSNISHMKEWLKDTRIDDNLLRDLSYTLCLRRTNFPLRYATYASGVAELIERLGEFRNGERITNANEAVFIFTGQGAQWPEMGMQLMQYSAFANTFRAADTCLKKLGASWSLLDEVSKPATSSHISDAALSQPAVTALQISLITILQDWDIYPTAVCGHSSGEIAASFAAGFLDLEACMAIAYYRGVAASKLCPNGAMMAVGASPAYIEPHLSSLRDGFATIACYNSPNSVTVAGDRAALVELGTRLAKTETFHRMLQVDVAYHTDQMISVADFYLQSIKGVLPSGPAKSASAIFYSSITGKPEPSHVVRSPWYWVTNMVSPVQFSRAMGRLLSDKRATEKLSFIEIGPHSALKGPLRDIAQSHQVATELGRLPDYFTALRRSENSCQDILYLASSLLNRGFDVDTAAVFKSTAGSSDYSLVKDLPGYSFNTSRRYWHESRLATEYEHHGSAWHVLLGHKVTGTIADSLEFRNVFSLDDIPWLRDHQVHGEAIFPAAGYMSMAIEAVRYLLRDAPDQIDGYRIREMTIGKAFRLAEAKNELFTILHPQHTGTRSSDSTSWFSFRFLSWVKETGFLEHCSGLISVTTRQKVNHITESSLHPTKKKWTTNLRKQIDKECDHDISPQGFYHQLDRVGFSYGPAFARVSGLRTGHQSAVGTVTCGDTACIMPLNFETPLRLHPATLDAMLHVGLCNVGGNQGDPTRVRTHVPTFVEEVSISEPMSQQPGDDFSVYTYGFDYEPMSRATRCSLVAFGPECEDPVIEIRGLKVFDVQEDSHKMASADAINPLTVDWQEHPAFIHSNSLAGWQDSVDATEAADEAEALRRQAYYLIKWALSAWDSMPAQISHLVRLRRWMETVVSDIETRSQESSEWTGLPDVERHDFVDQVAAQSLQGHFNAQVGRYLPAIINGQADALDVIFRRDDGVWRIYEESIFFSRSNDQLAELVHRLSHQSPSLRILEVGAGTGGGTSKVLAALTRSDGERQYETYDYTDISTGFFDNAQSKFEKYGGLSFKRFDVSKDPLAQDFTASSYDLVIAADVLHATPNVENSLRHIKKLLKPDGVLAFVELSHFHIGLFPFATLPDWWHKDDGPIIQEDEWNKLLLKSGFTGVEAAISDFPGFGIHKLYWTHAGQSKTLPITKVHLLPINETSPTLATEVCRLLQNELGQHSDILSLSESRKAQGTFMLLDENANMLLDLDHDQFEALKLIFSHAERVLWVTRSSDPKTRFASGFIKTMRLENPGVKMTLLHLDPTSHTNSASSIVKLWKHLESKDAMGEDEEVEFLEVGGRIQIPRLNSARGLYDLIDRDTAVAPVEQQKLAQPDRPLQLSMGTVGLLSTLAFCDHEVYAKPLGEDEVLVEIKCSGLNFKDVLIALGSLPWQGLGREASGVVVDAGDHAQTEFPLGSRVLLWGDNLLGTHARADTSDIALIPDDMAFEEAASVPVVYGTSYEGLVNLGRLQKGERVLIHAAAGGVGQAAIMIAQWIGAEVFCTVSSEEKRGLIMGLYNIPEDHIFSSRSPSFAEGLLAMTDMEGVDVVLNSLAGEMLRVSWQCIANFGRFIDISKRDFVANSNLEMAPFDRSATYAALDFSLWAKMKSTKACRTAITQVLGLLSTKRVRPIHPINAMSVSDLESGFRMLQTGKHVGKVVIRNEPNALVKVETRPSNITNLRLDASYIVTGGSGGIGQFIGRWMLENGAKYVILASRNIEAAVGKRPIQDMLKLAADMGGQVLSVPCDVGSSKDVQELVALAAERGMPPIRGVIHGAMVLKDAMFETTTVESWHAVVKPKVHGAMNLHKALANVPLDFLICLSSIVGTLGNPGQSSYAGSNSFLDAFCQWRVSQGLPGTSVALPVVSDVGWVAEMAASDPSAVKSGHLLDISITSEQVGHLIKAAMMHPNLGSHIVNGFSRSLDMARNRQMQNPILSHVRDGMARRFAGSSLTVVSNTKSVVGSDPIVNKESLMQAADIEGASGIVYRALSQKIAKDMMISPEDMTPESSLSQIGLDSLVAVEFRNWLAKELAVNMRIMEILNCKSMRDLVTMVVQGSSLLARLHGNKDS